MAFTNVTPAWTAPSSSFGSYASPSSFDATGIMQGSTPPSAGGTGGPGMLTAALGIGNLALGAFGMFKGQQQANRQIEAANANAAANRQANRDAAFIQMADNMANRSAQFGWGADLDFARQKEARMLETGIFGQRQMALDNRAKLFNQALANSPDAKERMRFENELNLQRDLAQRMGTMQGMFGPIAPINVSSMFS